MKNIITSDSVREEFKAISPETNMPAEEQHFYSEAFSRNLGLCSPDELEVLRNTTVAIPGQGGVGGSHLITLTRMGIGGFNIADDDDFSIANYNRQHGAMQSTLGKNKAHTMEAMAKDINPHLRFKTWNKKIDTSNVKDFLNGCQVVVDSLDAYAIEARITLFQAAREMNIPVISAGPLGFSYSMIIFSPEGPSLEKYLNIKPSDSFKTKFHKFIIGLAPSPSFLKYMDTSYVNTEKQYGPSSMIGINLCSAVAACNCLKIILKRGKVHYAPHYHYFDPYLETYKIGYMPWGNKNPTQRLKVAYLNNKLSKQLPQAPAKAQEMITSNDPKLPTGENNSIYHEIIRSGIQAPSGENTQPWKFKIEQNCIEIYIDKKADQSVFNVNQLASLISCGAAIENMIITANHFGQTANIRAVNELSGSDSTQLAATIELNPQEHQLSAQTSSDRNKEDLFSYIPKRHTNRTLFDRKPIPQHDLNALQTSIHDLSKTSLLMITDRKQLSDIADLIYQADTIRAENKQAHEFFIDKIRFTSQEAEANKTGFPIKNLEAGLMGELLLSHTRKWERMNFYNKLGLGKMIAKVSQQGIIQSSAVGLVKTSGSSLEDIINGGRAMQRIWLKATSLGIDFQPMTVITFFRTRKKLDQLDVFDKKHQDLLNRLWQQYDDLFSDADTPNETHIMLFRLGYGKSVKTRTLRKDVDEFMIT
jgi:molybdopterin/thiamine biosynthesis adenylyltransferase/nitroreductase